MTEKRTALLAAGGTGGHLFPAEALAHELKARGWAVHLASDERANRYAGSFPADAIHPIASATLGSKNPVDLARSFWAIWKGVRQASAVIKKIRPSIVIGFGGYPTLPPVFAATRRGVPTVIHEQNAVMGRANRALATRVSAIAGGFLDPARSAYSEKILVTGNPVRPAVLALAGAPYVQARSADLFRLLVFGGSQGAQFFSQALPAAIAKLPASERKRLVLTQQARPEDAESVITAFASLGIGAEVSPFFTDMAQRIADAQLIVARSGASTVSEIGVVGRPALLVPYPHALDHDQAANAAALEQAGGAEVHPQSTLSPERLAELIFAFMTSPTRLATMAAASLSVGKPDAARRLADLAEAVARGQSLEAFRKEAGL
ncbi:MAG: undecaprenyldiphospho-muramoylpentapeptide beta-N-acetylglucosaminyltransferase [Rhizobiaceae bacterium]|nr:undecaprenyldiphospho-muramoylpentapeptide beta-N-acetylglucosaminyltransferase [Rhizobiaceae bacterium]